MSNRGLAATALIAVSILAAPSGSSWAGWEMQDSFQLSVVGLAADTPWLATQGDDDSTAQFLGDATLDFRFKRRSSKGMFFEISAGLWALEGRQGNSSDVEPSSFAWNLAAELDLPWKIGAVPRLTVGLRLQERETDFGVVEFGDTRSLEVAAMLPWKVDGECEFSHAIVTWADQDFDDAHNAPGGAFDRSGDYGALGLEVSMLLGDTPDECERTGPFRQYLPYTEWNLRAGLNYRDEDTVGTQFDADYGRFFAEVTTPLKKLEGKPAAPATLDWRIEAAESDYGQVDRKDRSLLAEINARWRIKPNKDWPTWVRHFDVVFGVFAERRDSNQDMFDFTSGGVFLGLDSRFGRPIDGASTGGGTRVRNSSSTGGSDPKVSEEVAP